MSKYVIPKTHPSNHPLWSNKNCESEFRKTLRKFQEKLSFGRVFPETELWLRWYELLEKCMKFK